MTKVIHVTTQRRPRVVVVGRGFAGYHCLRRLPADAAELVAVNPTDYIVVQFGLVPPEGVSLRQQEGAGTR